MPDPILFRAIPFEEEATPKEPGGALHVPRTRQGAGRHDNPDIYGALYLSHSPEAAIAEVLQVFRGQELSDVDLVRADGRPLALCPYEWRGSLLDLDDPRVLVQLSLRPSEVATRHRRLTQQMARRLFEDGHAGFSWWSTLEASWIHVTLFAERVEQQLRISSRPEVLHLRNPALRSAAEAIGVRLRKSS